MVGVAAVDGVRAEERANEEGLKRWPAHLTALTFVALALAVVLAAAMLMISSLLLPDLADLMPPPLSGVH